jgi:hypothetical protein
MTIKIEIGKIINYPILVLCPNCHVKKTPGLLKTRKKSNRRLLIIPAIIIFIIITIF